MLGAICGDVIGSPYEFGKMKNYDFDLFVDNSRLTDDSFMTAAVAAALLSNDSIETLDQECAKQYKIFTRNHLDAGYGKIFKEWALSDDAEYKMSWGNGSAMRVSPVAYFYNSPEEVIDAATKTALPTHGSPEGIRGAAAIALSVFPNA